jgi:hypothetical protein
MRGDPAIAPLWDDDAHALLTWFRVNFDSLVAEHR